MQRNFFDARQFDGDLIIDGLYLGSYDSAQNYDELKKRNIKFIVNLVPDMTLEFTKKIDYLHIQIQDSSDQNLLSILPSCIDFISKGIKKNSVLVHCGAGISRASSVVIAYLMSAKRDSFENIWAFVKERRPWACPNSGFQRQLKLFKEWEYQINFDSKDYKDTTKGLERAIITHWKKGKEQLVRN